MHVFPFTLLNKQRTYKYSSRIVTLFFFNLIILLATCDKTSFFEIPGSFIYTIIEHNDSLYYSTPDGKVLRLSPDTPDSPVLIAFKKGHPFRSLVFKPDSSLFASSYSSGVYRVMNDSLEPVPFAWRATWSMKLDSLGNFWLASKHGVFRQTGDTLVRFTNLNEAYDIEFYNNLLAVAHRKGISFYNLQSGNLVRSICKDTICWLVKKFDTLLVGGGVECCVFIYKDSHKSIRLGPGNNIPWASALNKQGELYLATQKGLYRIKQRDFSAEYIAFKGKCIKSVYVDNKNRLWVGKYFK